MLKLELIKSIAVTLLLHSLSFRFNWKDFDRSVGFFKHHTRELHPYGDLCRDRDKKEHCCLNSLSKFNLTGTERPNQRNKGQKFTEACGLEQKHKHVCQLSHMHTCTAHLHTVQTHPLLPAALNQSHSFSAMFTPSTTRVLNEHKNNKNPLILGSVLMWTI